MHGEAGRHGRERVDDLLEPFARRRRSRRGVTAVAGADSVRSDVLGCGVCDTLRLLERGVEPGAEVFERLLGVLERQVAAVHEQLGVELADRAALADHLVHARLRERGLVALVVAVAPVAHHVDDDVLLEASAERERELGPRALLASGSSPFTWKIGACTALAMSVAYTVERAKPGVVVKPTWLLTTMCTVPPTS